MPPIWWAAGLGVLVLVLIVVGWSVQRGDGGDAAPDVAVDGGPTATAIVEPGPQEGAMPAAGDGTPGAVSVGGTTIGQIIWSDAVDPATQAPAEPLESIPDDSTEIYAALPLTSVAAGATIAATWTYNGEPLETLTSSVTATEASTDTWVAFRLDRVDPATPVARSEADWPDGEYGIVVTVDGQTVQEATVMVEETF